MAIVCHVICCANQIFNVIHDIISEYREISLNLNSCLFIFRHRSACNDMMCNVCKYAQFALIHFSRRWLKFIELKECKRFVTQFLRAQLFWYGRHVLIVQFQRIRALFSFVGCVVFSFKPYSFVEIVSFSWQMCQRRFGSFGRSYFAHWHRRFWYEIWFDCGRVAVTGQHLISSTLQQPVLFDPRSKNRFIIKPKGHYHHSALVALAYKIHHF